MRKDLLIIVVLLMGGAFIAYNNLGNSPLAFHSVRGVVNVEPAPTDGKPADKSVRVKIPRHSSDGPGESKRTPDQAVSDAAVTPPSTATALPARSDPPFPVASILKTGSTTTEIRATFGAPFINIAGTSDGHVLERFYYVNRDRTQLTVLTMKNGRLASSESLSGPYFQLPSATEPQHEAYAPR